MRSLVPAAEQQHGLRQVVVEDVGRGEKLETILTGMQAVAEGVRTARAAFALARRYQVDMPITQEINAVLYDNKSCRKAVSDLMERDAKPEKEWA